MMAHVFRQAGGIVAGEQVRMLPGKKISKISGRFVLAVHPHIHKPADCLNRTVIAPGGDDNSSARYIWRQPSKRIVGIVEIIKNNQPPHRGFDQPDRKSTRLNSS